MKAKVIILSTNNIEGAIWWSGHKLYTKPPEDPSRGELNHLYLIDPNVKIKEGDWCVNNNYDTLYQPNCRGDISSWNKVLATTDKSLNLLILSKQSIKLLIDYYNKNGKRFDEIEVDTFTDKGLPNEIVVKMNGTVDITIPEEKMYSREDMLKLRDLANAIINPACDILPDTYDEEIDNYYNWISENL
jgi:hypothetical protein